MQAFRCETRQCLRARQSKLEKHRLAQLDEFLVQHLELVLRFYREHHVVLLVYLLTRAYCLLRRALWLIRSDP